MNELGGYTREALAKRLIEFGETDPTARSPLSNRHIAEIVGSQLQRIAELEKQVHSLKYEPDGQLRANLSNDAIQSILDTAGQHKRHIDAIAEALHPAHKEAGWSFEPDQLAGMVRELREQITTMGHIRIEHPYGDPITIYQEQLLAKRQGQIDALQREIAALRGDKERLKNFMIGMDLMLDQHQRGVIPVLDCTIIREDIREQLDAARTNSGSTNP